MGAYFREDVHCAYLVVGVDAYLEVGVDALLVVAIDAYLEVGG